MKTSNLSPLGVLIFLTLIFVISYDNLSYQLPAWEELEVISGRLSSMKKMPGWDIKGYRKKRYILEIDSNNGNLVTVEIPLNHFVTKEGNLKPLPKIGSPISVARHIRENSLLPGKSTKYYDLRTENYTYLDYYEIRKRASH